METNKIHTSSPNFEIKTNRITTIKGLLCLAALVGAIAAMIFLSGSFLPYGIGAAVLASYGVYHYISQYCQNQKIFNATRC